MKRIKTVAPVIATRAQAETLAGELRELAIDARKLQLEAESAKKAIDTEIGPPLEKLRAIQAEKLELLEGWAEANPSEFGAKKSLQFVHGLLGWRTGMPKLKLLPSWTWERVLSCLQSLNLSRYIRVSEEVNRQAIIDERDTVGPTLHTFGVKIVQDEPFFFEPKIEDNG